MCLKGSRWILMGLFYLYSYSTVIVIKQLGLDFCTTIQRCYAKKILDRYHFRDSYSNSSLLKVSNAELFHIFYMRLRAPQQTCACLCVIYVECSEPCTDCAGSWCTVASITESRRGYFQQVEVRGDLWNPSAGDASCLL